MIAFSETKDDEAEMWLTQLEKTKPEESTGLMIEIVKAYARFFGKR